jgi:hypothetical protein
VELKVEFGDWLASERDAVQGALDAENTAERLEALRQAPATEIPDFRAGWLAGYHDALQGILDTAPPGILMRKINVPPPPG